MITIPRGPNKPHIRALPRNSYDTYRGVFWQCSTPTGMVTGYGLSPKEAFDDFHERARSVAARRDIRTSSSSLLGTWVI